MDQLRKTKEQQKSELVKHIVQIGKIPELPWKRTAWLLDIDIECLSNTAIRKKVKSRLTTALKRYTDACEQRQALDIAETVSHKKIKVFTEPPSLSKRVRLPKQLKQAEEFISNANRSKFKLRSQKSSGIKTQLNFNSDIENEITIGLDFGTSSIKAVVRDLAGNTFLVPFGDLDSTQKYLLPTCLYETNNGFSLIEGEKSHRDLKLALMSGNGDLAEEKAVAFIALVLRHIRAWLFKEYRSLYKSDFIIWGINIGLPAKSYDDKEMVNLFHKVGLAAANLSADRSRKITLQKTRKYLIWAEQEQVSLSQGNDPDDTLIMSDMVHVIPEIAAQVAGYIRSDSWDAHHNMMMLVDVGAGTVDASVFTVTKPDEHQFAFLSSSVCPYGVMNLHRRRIDWLRSNIGTRKNASLFLPYLDEIYAPTDRIDAIPQSWKEYIKGMSVTNTPSPDQELYEQYRAQLYDETITLAKASNPSTPEWASLPFFLCGGGSKMEIYQNFIKLMNNRNCSTPIRLKPLQMKLPKGLEAKGLREQDYHRFSVAYGLSYPREIIGKCIPEIEIPPLNRSMNRHVEAVAITKDMM